MSGKTKGYVGLLRNPKESICRPRLKRLPLAGTHLVIAVPLCKQKLKSLDQHLVSYICTSLEMGNASGEAGRSGSLRMLGCFLKGRLHV